MKPSEDPTKRPTWLLMHAPMQRPNPGCGRHELENRSETLRPVVSSGALLMGKDWAVERRSEIKHRTKLRLWQKSPGACPPVTARRKSATAAKQLQERGDLGMHSGRKRNEQDRRTDEMEIDTGLLVRERESGAHTSRDRYPQLGEHSIGDQEQRLQKNRNLLGHNHEWAAGQGNSDGNNENQNLDNWLVSPGKTGSRQEQGHVKSPCLLQN
jgi:hypothetical protein